MQRSNLKLGELLLYSGKIDNQQLKLAVEEQEISTKKLGEILVEKGWVSASDIVEALEYQLGFERIDLSKYNINVEYVTMIPESIARRYNVIAVDQKEDKLVVAMVDPLDFFAMDDIKLYTKMEIEPIIGTNEEIIQLIDRYYSGESARKVLAEFSNTDYIVEGDDLEEQEILEVTSAPIVRLLNSIIEQAVRSNASDIHIEPVEESIRVRLRINGDLTEIMNLSKKNLSPIVTRIKIMGKMNIAEKRLPQDGRIETIIDNKEIDMRISTLPTVHGEKVVVRLLDKSSFNFTKESLGFSKNNLKVFNEILTQPYGMILVTGPTGSGKTTTLYTILRELNQIEKNIITIEDPVEYKLDGINQVQVNSKSGLNFATGLRSILRQDPDIVMVGEIRDSETAHIAIRAAITGHLVLSTLHTNDSPSTIARLVDMGVEPYLVSSAVIGVVSQRLVKVLCDKCKSPYEASYSEKQMLNVDTNEDLTLYKPVGCNNCNQGYKSRTAVHEVMPVREALRKLVDDGANIDNIKRQALKEGMTTLLQGSIDLVLNGITSYDEAMKVGFTLG